MRKRSKCQRHRLKFMNETWINQTDTHVTLLLANYSLKRDDMFATLFLNM